MGCRKGEAFMAGEKAEGGSAELSRSTRHAIAFYPSRYRVLSVTLSRSTRYAIAFHPSRYHVPTRHAIMFRPPRHRRLYLSCRDPG
jgi:hypothetical protein